MGDNYNKAKALFVDWLLKRGLQVLENQSMVQKALSAKCRHEVPRVRLKDTEWGRNYKQLYGKEYGEI